MPAAMPCKIRERTCKETCRNPDAENEKYACIVEADESTRKRLEGTPHKDHEDHVAGEGTNSLNHNNFVHNFIPYASSNENTGCESSSGQRMRNTRENTGMAADESQKQKEVIAESRKEGKTVLFASFMDICHLKNSELEPKRRTYKGRVEFRGDIVKDDSGSCAVFTE